MYLLLFISDSVLDTACVYHCENHILKCSRTYHGVTMFPWDPNSFEQSGPLGVNSVGFSPSLSSITSRLSMAEYWGPFCVCTKFLKFIDICVHIQLYSVNKRVL